MTKREAKQHFLSVSCEEGLNDKPAMRYAWGLYTDMLCRCLLYTSPSPRDKRQSRMPSSA